MRCNVLVFYDPIVSKAVDIQVPGDSRSWESPEKGGQCLSVIYLNIVPLIIKNFTKYLETHPSEQIHTKKSPEKLLRCPRKP